MSRSASLRQQSSWAGIAARQYGVISRRQLLELGLSADQARQWIRSGRWQRVLDGVYATFTGPLPERAILWAAVLYAGPGALITGRSALWLLGALDDPPPRPIQIAVPNRRRAKNVRGVHITRSRTRSEREPTRGSPPTRAVEEAALDACDSATQLNTVLDIIFRVCQRRLTTAARMTQTLRERSRHRWRQLIEDVLADVRNGVASVLEQRYRRDVERAHRLPSGLRNRPETDGGTCAYRESAIGGGAPSWN